MVGDRQRLQPEPGGLLGQLLGVAGAVEEREVGVAVQLGVRHASGAFAVDARPGASNGWRWRLHAGPSPPAFHDLKPVLAVIPEHCYERSTLRGLGLFAARC